MALQMEKDGCKDDRAAREVEFGFKGNTPPEGWYNTGTRAGVKSLFLESLNNGYHFP